MVVTGTGTQARCGGSMAVTGRASMLGSLGRSRGRRDKRRLSFGASSEESEQAHGTLDNSQ